MSRGILSSKLPYIDDNNSIDDVVNHMVKTINGTTTKSLISSVSQSFTDTFPVGTIMHSMLTEVQFQSQMNTNWVLMDGRSVAGSVYSSLTGSATIPDATGRFLRGKGANNPDGNLALGTYQSDTSRVVGGIAFDGSSYPLFGASGSGSAYGNETRPKNITVNIFIKIN